LLKNTKLCGSRPIGLDTTHSLHKAETLPRSSLKSIFLSSAATGPFPSYSKALSIVIRDPSVCLSHM